MSNTTPIQVIARLKVQADKVAPMTDLMARLRERGRSAPGNLRFEVLQCASDPTLFVTQESWADLEAADTHMSSGYVGESLKALGPFLAGAPEITRFSALG